MATKPKKSALEAAMNKKNSTDKKEAVKSVDSSDTLTNDEIEALESVSGGTFKKVSVNDKTMYEVTIPATKRISAKGLRDAADHAIQLSGLLSKGDNQSAVQSKIQSGVEKETIQRSLKQLKGMYSPPTEAKLDI